MRAGDLRARVRILQPAGSLSATGGITPADPVTVADNLPAAIEPAPVNLQGRETAQGGNLSAVISYVIRLRYLPGITTAMYVQEIGGEERTFQIVSRINVGNRNQELHLLAYEQ